MSHDSTAKSSSKAPYILGLDIGTNSIGWAALATDGAEVANRIVATGVRIFQEAVDAKTRTPKNQARRIARGMRRRRQRYLMRRSKLLNALIGLGLLPKDLDERSEVLTNLADYEPYLLRKRALDEKLSAFQIGRVIFHLNQRRGFKSNRKEGKKDTEDGVVKAGIAALEQEMDAQKARTLGEFLHSQPRRRNRYPFHDRYTNRAMYEKEFDLIWSRQVQFQPNLCTVEAGVRLKRIIFFQRPLRIQKYLVGFCTFEPRRRRAMKAWPLVQRFRMLQDVNHLQIIDTLTRDYRALREDERGKLLAALEKCERLSFKKARKLLGLHEGETFNLEDLGREHLFGSSTSYRLMSILEKASPVSKEIDLTNLVTDLLTIFEEAPLLKRLSEHWGFSPEIAKQLAELEFEVGYARLSHKAITRILPHLEAGHTYDKACSLAGYDHARPTVSGSVPELGDPPVIRNPVVQKALFEVRRLVNAIVRKYGMPERIRIELAREIKLTGKRLIEHNREQTKRAKENEALKERLRSEFGMQEPSLGDIEKLKLHGELPMCPYTGRMISVQELFSPEVQVEHILPYSRSLDDSYMNKTLAFASVNALKGNKSPYEMFIGDSDAYLQLIARVRQLPFGKRSKFELKELKLDDFVHRQLTDTQYISLEAKRYMESLGVPVDITKGQCTAHLRRGLGLNRILARDDAANDKKVRSDHRHHAIDAIVIALTSPEVLKAVATHSSRRADGGARMRLTLQPPWEAFVDEVNRSVAGIIVSHSSSRRISDAFHEETCYGYNPNEDCYVVRKNLESFSDEKQLVNIVDPIVQELVRKRLMECNGDFKKAFGSVIESPLFHKDKKTPIYRVRMRQRMSATSMLAKKDAQGRPYKFFALGNNHHVELIRNKKNGKVEPIFVSTLEAANRGRRLRQPIVRRDHGPEKEFMFSLCANDIVEYEDKRLGRQLFRVQKMSNGKRCEITLRLHSESTTDSGILAGEVRISSLAALPRLQKVSVSVLGEVSPSND